MNRWDHFKDEKEFWDWVELKKKDSDDLYPQNLEHPPKEGVNKWTAEFYYTYNKGKNNAKSGEIREKFQRGATDAASSLGSSGLEVSVDVTVQKYSVAVKQATQALGRLGRQLSTAEPHQIWVKKNQPDRLDSFRKGLAECRDTHLAGLEQLEELKEKTKIKDGEQALQEATDLLDKVTKEATDCIRALTAACQVGGSPIKLEGHPASVQPAAGSGPPSGSGTQ